MNANPEFASLARLVESLRPWLDQVVVVGGWAHRLYRLHPFAQQLRYEPLATLDADIALPTRFKVTGDEIYKRLGANGFKAEFLAWISTAQSSPKLGTFLGSSLIGRKTQG